MEILRSKFETGEKERSLERLVGIYDDLRVSISGDTEDGLQFVVQRIAMTAIERQVYAKEDVSEIDLINLVQTCK
ncbi:Ff.00g102590.m01.CDS01 [Fusarium sp. VM40]|nr:Ff.00g102590.m01.CDS01 [Fusarium sp. VM40]